MFINCAEIMITWLLRKCIPSLAKILRRQLDFPDIYRHLTCACIILAGSTGFISNDSLKINTHTNAHNSYNALSAVTFNFSSTIRPSAPCASTIRTRAPTSS